jgi:hypothetical protein
MERRVLFWVLLHEMNTNTQLIEFPIVPCYLDVGIGKVLVLNCFRLVSWACLGEVLAPGLVLLLLKVLCSNFAIVSFFLEKIPPHYSYCRHSPLPFSVVDLLDLLIISFPSVLRPT